MSVQSPVLQAPRSMTLSAEFRVYERQPCGIETACQPIAARGDNDMSWDAEIHDVSVAGVGLILKRRFERGAGLAVEIPETPTAPADTLLSKVVHVTGLPDGRWLLGCAFVSHLSEDEVQRLVAMGQGQAAGTPSSPETDEPTLFDEDFGSKLIQDVTWTGMLGGKTVHRLVRRVHLTGNWPPAAGTVLKVWFGKRAQAKARLRVNGCRRQDGRWVVDYTFLDRVLPEVQRSFGHRSA